MNRLRLPTHTAYRRAIAEEKELLRDPKFGFLHFYRHYARTFDEKRGGHGQLMPQVRLGQGAANYLEYMAWWLQWSGRQRLVSVVEKSRDLLSTWIHCAYGVWSAVINPHAIIYVQGMKEKGAKALVSGTKKSGTGRMQFIVSNMRHERLGPWLTELMSPNCVSGEITLRNGAQIIAAPTGVHGGDAMRQYHPLLALFTEFDRLLISDDEQANMYTSAVAASQQVKLETTPRGCRLGAQLILGADANLGQVVEFPSAPPPQSPEPEPEEVAA